MKKIIWTKLYETGFDTIDYQHKILVERINDLIELNLENSSQDKLYEILLFLEEYSIYHFDTEEHLFNSFNYTESKEHYAEHYYFKQKIKNFKLDYKKGLKKIDNDLMIFLINWLINHVTGTDKKFVEYLFLQIKDIEK